MIYEQKSYYDILRDAKYMRYYISNNDEYLPGPNGMISNILWFKESFYEDRNVNDSDS